jgi:hypothetical protein
MSLWALNMAGCAMVILMFLVYLRAVVMSLPTDKLILIVKDELNILMAKVLLPPNFYKISYLSDNSQLFPSIFNKIFPRNGILGRFLRGDLCNICDLCG